ncbi:MAG: 6-bladed beta-propeller [Planctomycetota bacterium]|nr:6-bladed beta-propeller [Planctomycetota bacterium]
MPSHPPNSNRTTRRAFLKQAAVASLAAPIAAPFVHAQDKSGLKNVVIGKGAYQYECIHDWGMEHLPQGAHYGNASHGVTIDQEGQLYVTHYGDPGSVFVFDTAGKFVKSLGGFHHAVAPDPAPTGRGHGIDIRTEGSEQFLYLAASDATMDFVKMNMKGEIVWRKGLQDLKQDCGRYGEGVAYRPTNTSFSPDGGYFLGDGYGANLIHQYDKNDKYVRTIGGIGSGPGQFRTPHGQWLDNRDDTPKLVVADRANKRLQWFDLEGNHLNSLDGFLFPADIDVQGDLLMVPDLHCRITLLDKQNNVVAQLGDDDDWRKLALDGFKMRNEREKWLPGKFIHPHDACFDADGNIFVAEWVKTGRVTKLKKV